MKHIIIIVIALVSFSNLNAQWYQVNSNTTENIKDIFMLDSLNGYCVGGGDQFGFPQGNGIIMETIDGGGNWTGLFAMDSLSVNNVFVVTAGQNQKLIAFATKNGTSFMLWTTINTQFQNWILEPISYTPIEPKLHNNAIYFVDEYDSLKKIENNSVDNIMNNVGIFSINSNEIIYINNTYDSIFKSIDDGTTWQQLQNYPSSFGSNQQSHSIIKSYSDTIITHYTYPASTSYSFDNGLTWSVTNEDGIEYCKIVNSSLLLGAFGNTLFSQINFGEWQQQEVLENVILNIKFYNTNLAFITGENGMIYKTNNGEDLVGINELQSSKKKIKIYPNPAKDILQIEIDNNEQIENVKLFDLQGKLIKEYKNGNLQVDVSRIPNGEYVLSIKTEEGIFTEKVVITR